MSLREYRHKRQFSETPEPKGTRRAAPGHLFVVQKHAASHLHYDFRLELDGVLKSWAVPKGPCLDPSVKRLAIHVEDHPIAYGAFEGVIPEGQYGGGTVMLWDHGEWEPAGDADQAYKLGKLKFTQHGQKLRGGWMLVRSGARGKSDGKQWLLFKERDDEARPLAEYDILKEQPLSVTSERNLSDIAANQDHVWGQNDNGHAQASPSKRRTTGRRSKKGEPMPGQIEVELATRAEEAPEGDQWIHEVKFDGYRILCRIEGDRVELISRNQKDWTDRFAALASAAHELSVNQALFDGEIVALRADGVSDFQELQNALQSGGSHLHYYIFDLLHLNGEDLRDRPLIERKQILADLLKKEAKQSMIHLSEHIVGNGPAFLRAACKKRLEGIVSKRADRPYIAGRGTDWLKVKCLQTDEFVIGGYTNPAGERVGFGALLVGYHNDKGELIYAGKVGTGYADRTLKMLQEKLQRLDQASSPFQDHKRPPKGTHWVKPTLIAQVTFGSRTHEGILRHASFQGLRDDKSAEEITRETAVPLKRALRKAVPERIPTRNAQEIHYDPAKQQYGGVRLTHRDKILYPEQGITKLELADYYRMIAPWILPHLADRPLVLVRCPEGLGKACFYQKHAGVGTPDNLRRFPVEEKSKTEEYVLVDDEAGLISLAQMGVLEIHAWGSRTKKLEQPDRLIFDLDPDPEVPWARVVSAARQVREFLKQLHLESFVKTTGGKGLHLVLPIKPKHDWDEAKALCKQIADAMVRADSNHFTANMAKAARHGKIFIDYLRNSRGATAVQPYSPRARSGAPVSTPLAWEELSSRLHSDHYTIRNIMKRLKSLKSDPWKRIGDLDQSLDKAITQLRRLLGPE